MGDEPLLDELAAADTDRVLAALFRVGGADRSVAPSAEVIRQVIALLDHADPDVRHRAAFVAGLRWGSVDALPKLLRLLADPDEDPLVRTCAAGAVGGMAHDHPAARDVALPVLADVVFRDDTPDEVRDAAYTDALWAAGRITANERSEQAVLATGADRDRSWLEVFARRAEPTAPVGR